MKRSYLGEKHQRFSLRKVSVGLVSALVVEEVFLQM
ncbi:YSIRK-type signal peptide-containing protein [uncultured Streptococcus sp.]|nr:YSIRK-type signal peptide-containing protein [uncultured Streptococcus sp.]